MTVRSSRLAPPWTESKLQALPNDGQQHEVVAGQLVMSPKNDFYHGWLATRIAFTLEIYNRRRRLGLVLDSSPGFWMENRNCRAPDVSFVLASRLRQLGFRPSTRTFFPGAPDLAVEILSPNQTRSGLDERLRDFFSSGTRLAWIVDADERHVEVLTEPGPGRRIGSAGILHGEPVLPGFRLPLAELFADVEGKPD